MFGFIKKLFSKNTVRRSVDNFLSRQAEYIAMSKDEIAHLPEEELFDMALARVFDIAEKNKRFDNGFSALNDTQRAFYTASLYEMEVMNGGLAQFFDNSSRNAAPMLSEALSKIRAGEHKELYSKFISDNNITFTDLSVFDSEEHLNSAENMPFNEFDSAFYNMKPIRDYLTDYVKEHISEF